jgi:hypothetical protein
VQVQRAGGRGREPLCIQPQSPCVSV